MGLPTSHLDLKAKEVNRFLHTKACFIWQQYSWDYTILPMARRLCLEKHVIHCNCASQLLWWWPQSPTPHQEAWSLLTITMFTSGRNAAVAWRVRVRCGWQSVIFQAYYELLRPVNERQVERLMISHTAALSSLLPGSVAFHFQPESAVNHWFASGDRIKQQLLMIHWNRS